MEASSKEDGLGQESKLPIETSTSALSVKSNTADTKNDDKTNEKMTTQMKLQQLTNNLDIALAFTEEEKKSKKNVYFNMEANTQRNMTDENDVEIELTNANQNDNDEKKYNSNEDDDDDKDNDDNENDHKYNDTDKDKGKDKDTKLESGGQHHKSRSGPILADKFEPDHRTISHYDPMFEQTEYAAKNVIKPVFNNVFMEKFGPEVDITEAMGEIRRLFCALHFLQEG
ncbi:hypothetical protein RFI_18102 [Reticulomyxa filosa]|uniref:Uncharacterized protein n=1 Tax=Reticulomyxa filosa TaxID=46433 RepID=X6MYL9_RETFI|nr:hypothetical protein RFI_18102 [Reticulomyxa filosa]|eukprot:ETO19135.1 hypothetical protein RFI_18102 [Reticulomyxa filosa]